MGLIIKKYFLVIFAFFDEEKGKSGTDTLIEVGVLPEQCNRCNVLYLCSV